MSVLSWGKPKLYKKDLDDKSGKWEEIPTPVENSTKLTPTKGDKKEAPLEGGENEDVRYSKNTYEVAYQIRRAKGKTMPFEDNDGLIEHNYAFALVPENEDAPGFIVDKSTVSAEDDFSTEEGASITYTHSVLKPDTGNQIKWGKVKVTGSGSSITAIAIDDSSDDDA